MSLMVLWAVSYAGLLAIYFGLCGLFHYLNAACPERQIQRRPKKDLVAMEIRQSVKSLALISLFLAGGLYVQGKGWTVAPLELGWVTTPVMFLVSLVIYDAWFYWGHRMMHTRTLYRFHQHHHKSVVPSPWSNNSDTMVGAFVEQSYFFFIVFVLPIPPAVLIAHKIFDQVTGIAGHAGHEYFASRTARWPWPGLCTTFHDQHHGYFNYNYANTFSWWDRMMGTLHPSYDDVVEHFERMPRAAAE
ncbi:MAG: hypothetical protein RLZ98_1618 [Pseudomonadota bacterium]|jgi:sterol desaturase/sphingolipid hydroxylase (fatty acid hydroxylase superfamily)